MRAVDQRDSPAAHYAIPKVVRAGSLPCRHPDFAAARRRLLTTLADTINRHWADDHTGAVPDSVAAIGDLIAAWVQVRAAADVSAGLQVIASVTVKAVPTGRVHIGVPGSSELARLLPVLTVEADEGVRYHYVERWMEAVLAVAVLVPDDHAGALMSTTDPLVAVALSGRA